MAFTPQPAGAARAELTRRASSHAAPHASSAAAATAAAAAQVSSYAPPLATFFVASVPHASVGGAGGAVYDGAARLYAPPGTFPATWTARWPAGPSAALAAQPAERYDVLATVIQPYGWMYYHFVVETLPKLVLLRDTLPSAAPQLHDGEMTSAPASSSSSDGGGGGGTAGEADAWNATGARLLLWGMPWEGEWLDLLRVPRAARVAYDPARRYAASLLLLPSPVPAVTPSAEALHAAREAVCTALPAAACGGARDVLVYSSRTGERSRAVANEERLLDALRRAFPALRVVVHRRGASAAEAVATFARAAAVVGPHGAGLSHILFCQPGTVVVELVFMHSPPMMFWHISAALQLQYAMAPLPRSFWCVAQVASIPRRSCEIRAGALTRHVLRCRWAQGTSRQDGGHGGGCGAAAPPAAGSAQQRARAGRGCARLRAGLVHGHVRLRAVRPGQLRAGCVAAGGVRAVPAGARRAAGGRHILRHVPRWHALRGRRALRALSGGQHEVRAASPARAHLRVLCGERS
jgi:hypothetical protein